MLIIIIIIIINSFSSQEPEEGAEKTVTAAGLEAKADKTLTDADGSQTVVADNSPTAVADADEECKCDCHGNTEQAESTGYCECAQAHWHQTYVQYVKVGGRCSDCRRGLLVC